MPINRDAGYPADWTLISAWIRVEVAGGRCMCPDGCGSKRHPVGWGRCDMRNGALLPGGGRGGRPARVVLTVAHLDHNPANNDLSNLRALCQACHLHHDVGQHAASRARSRAEAATANTDTLF